MRPWSFLSRVKGRAGFTLVEVLMAATVFSVIAVGLAGTFMSGLRLWKRICGPEAAARFVLLDLQKLGQDLRSSIDVPQIGFTGTDTGCSFPSAEGGRLVKVVYAFDASAQKLTRTAHPFDPAADEGRQEGAGLARTVLEAEEMHFRYVDPYITETLEWIEDWPKEKGMFKALRVEGKSKGEPFARIIIIPQA